MKLLEKLQKKKTKMQEQIHRGRVKTEQIRAKKLRKRKERTKSLEPGTIRYGLANRQDVGGLMHDALERRRNKRKDDKKH